MIKFDLDIDIYRPLQEVFAFVVTPENDFHWQYGTLMSTQISKGEMGMGTTFRAVGHFMGRRMESVSEVTEYEVNRRYGFKSRSGALDSYTLFTFDVIKGRTRVNVYAQVDPRDVSTTSDTATEKRMKKQYRENLALLKAVLEARQAEKLLDAGGLVSSRRR